MSKSSENLINIEKNKELIREVLEVVEKDDNLTQRTLSNKLDKALDSSAMNAFKVALDQAKNKDQVKDVLSQIFNELGEDGKKYLQQALKELAAVI